MQEIKFKEEWTKQIIESPNIGICVVNKERKIVFMNPILCDLLGHTPGDLIGKSAREFHIDQKSYEEFGKKAFEFVLKGQPVKLDYKYKKKDGTIFWAHITGDLVQNQEEILWTVIDITKRKQIEEENYKHAQLLEQIIDGIIVTDKNNIITYWNKAAQKILGYTKEDMIGKPPLMLFKEEDLPRREAILQELKAKGYYSTEFQVVAKDGSFVDLEVNSAVLKNQDGEFIGFVSTFKDIREKKEAQQKLQYQAQHDALTGLANRTLFVDRMNQAIKKAKCNETLVALFFIDLDHFKEINDSFGHDIGDQVLLEATKRLQSTIREHDSLARIGGDEFTIIIEDLKKVQDISRFVQNLFEAFQKPFFIYTHKFYITLSVGISIYPQDATTTQDLLKYADTAMYKAKEEGRNGYQFYNEMMTQLAFERVVLETQIREAIHKKEFVVYYQPQVDLHTGEIKGFEALVRWRHPQFGLITPAKFIPLAEESGLILDINYFVMDSALKQFKQWKEKGLDPGNLALNLPAIHLKDQTFLKNFKDLITKYKCQCSKLEFEITESQIMKNPQQSIEVLKKLREMGIQISIDDFGTGYSSLTYLKRLPITKLKIDRSFISDLSHDEEDRAITSAIIALAKSLKLKMVARS